MVTHEGTAEWADLEQYSHIPMFNTKAVVQQTRVPAPTLRAWERRYTLIAPERANNDYRLYSERDIVLIRWLKERVDEGMSISQAIAFFRHLSEEHQQEQQSQATHALPTESPPVFQVAITPPQPRHARMQTSNIVKELVSPFPNSEPRPPVLHTQKNYPPIENLHAVQEKLITAFKNLDEFQANTIMGSMLTVYSVEQICTDLITPTMWLIGQLWAEGSLTVTIEHFASNFFRALLTNLYQTTPSQRNGPLTLVGSAPGEPHELAPLTLALFLRRANIRVAYLGQGIETAGLIHTLRQIKPAIVCVSLTMSSYLSALINLGRQIKQLPPPTPRFVFGGQVFSHYSTIIPQINGTYLDGNMLDVVSHIQALLEEYEEKA